MCDRRALYLPTDPSCCIADGLPLAAIAAHHGWLARQYQTSAEMVAMSRMDQTTLQVGHQSNWSLIDKHLHGTWSSPYWLHCACRAVFLHTQLLDGGCKCTGSCATRESVSKLQAAGATLGTSWLVSCRLTRMFHRTTCRCQQRKQQSHARP